jgi:predicted transcriptional regulator
VIRVGTIQRARRELREDLATLERGERVRRPREIWFSTLNDAAKTLSERRLDLLRLLHQKRPHSEVELARLAKRSLKSVTSDVRALGRVGLVEIITNGDERRLVATYDHIHVAGDIALARAAA